MACEHVWTLLRLANRRSKIQSPNIFKPNIQRRSYRHLMSLELLKQLEIDVHKLDEAAKERGIPLPYPDPEPLPDSTQATLKTTRLPRAVQAVFLRPLRRIPEHEIPVCDLQLRSYSVRNLEHMADFAMRAAYYLSLPAKGPVPLPRIVERFTVPRSPFIFKKSQENFERITMRRLIQIQDGHADTVRVWLAYLQKNQYHGVGMKANVWENEGLDVAERMERREREVKESLRAKVRLFGRRKGPMSREKMEEIYRDVPYRRAFAGISREA